MKKSKFVKLLLHASLLFLFGRQVYSATFYISPSGNDTSGSGSSATPWKTTTKAFAQGGGHTYIFKDGTYNYSGGDISNPPSGSAGAYTIIRAENDGGAILRSFDQAMSIDGKSYIQIEGLTIKDGTGSHAIYITDSNHIKLMRVGVKNGIAWNAQYGNVVELSSLDGVTGTKDCLLEDVWVVGAMRYGILIGGTAGYSERNILRRCIVRFDGGGSPEPHAGISNYGSTSGIDGARNNVLQNCITLDFNAADNSGGEGVYAGFYNPHSATNVDFYGCIALNTRERGWMLNEDAGSSGNDLYNCLIWDALNEGIAGQRSQSTGSIIEQLTVGSSGGDAYNSYNGMVGTLRNSMFYNNGGGISGATSNTYNHFWQDTASGSNSLSSDPLQRYIARIESNSPAYQSGSGGLSRGATIEKKYGASGALHGETGYNTLTSENLWPWPNQQRIHDLFAEADGISGMSSNIETRGFAAAGQTLTNYVWNYMGNGNPYPDTPGTTSPSVSITNPANNATVSGSVSLTATASDNISVSRVEFIVNGSVRGTAFSAPYIYVWDTAAETNGAYGVQAKAYDSSGNTNTQAISVTVNNVADATPPTVSVTAPANGATVSGSVSVTATASDNVSVTRVQFIVDGVIVSTDATSPYSYAWDSSAASNGAHTITAKAFDAKSNNASGAVSVTVSNSIQTIVPTSSTWKYLDNGSNQGTAWRAVSFNDASWASGGAELGYGDGDETTVVSYGSDAANKFVTTYFRRTFNLTDPSTVSSLILSLKRDDGAVVYLNGTEVLRDSMPTGTISNTTLASGSPASETEFMTASVSPSLLVAGTNVLAVEIHQNDVGSSDISFDAGLIANASGAIDSTPPTVSITAPANGATVSGTVSLTATASDAVGVARVEFSVDGVLKNSDTTSPYSYSWNTTTETNGSHTLIARAYDAAGNSAANSVTVTASNVVPDTTVPTVSITAPTSGSALSGSVSVNVTASDNVGVTRVEISVDGIVKSTDVTSPYSYSWNTFVEINGSHTVAARAFDAAGNSASVSVTVTISNVTPDTTPPTVSITAPSNGVTVSGNIPVNVTATDNVGVNRVEYSVDGVSVSTDIASPFVFNWNTASYSNGSHTVTAKAFDAAGNNTSASITVTVSNVTPDTIPPTVSITAPANGATVSGSVNVTANASDAIGVARVQFIVDGVVKSTDSASPFSYGWNTATETNGSHTLSAKAFDAAGNNTSASVTVTVSNATPDTTPPTISISAPANGATVSGTASVNATASDGVGVTRVEISVDGIVKSTDVTSPYSYSWNTLVETNGSHAVTARAYDAAGNSASASVTVTVSNTVPDTTLPTVSITSPINGTTVSGNIPVNVTAADNVGVNRVVYFVDGVSISTDNASPYVFNWNTASYSNVSHAVTARAYDAAGNSASASVTVTVSNVTPDTTPPTASVTSPANGATVSGSVNISATATDNIGVARVQFIVDGVVRSTDNASPFSYNWNTVAETNGSHSLVAKAFDAAGNNASASITVTVSNSVPDATLPTVSLTAPANGATVSGTTSVNATASDNVGVARVEFSVDGVLRNSDTTNPYSYSWNTTAETNASHTLLARAYDAAGNSASVSVTVTVSNVSAGDTTVPTISVSNPANGSKVYGTVSVSANASDNVGVSRVEFYIDGSLKTTDTTSPYSYSWNTKTASYGSHSVSARAYDAAGNNAAGSVSVTRYRTRLWGVKGGGSATGGTSGASATGSNTLLISILSDDPAFSAASIAIVLQLPSGNKNLTLTKVSPASSIYLTEVDESVITLAEIEALTGQDVTIVLGSESILAEVETNMLSPELGGTIIENGSGGASVIFAPNSLTHEAQLTISPEPVVSQLQRDNALISQNLVSLGAGREMTFVSSGTMTNATLILPYNGSLIPSGYDASQIHIAYYNPATNRWELQVTGPITNTTVQTTVTHFSLYKPVLQVTDAAGLQSGESYVFPNPSVFPDEPTIRASLGDVVEINLKIYDLGGQEVYSTALPANPTGYSNGQAYYDFTWSGTKSNGMYLALVEGKTASGSAVRSRSNFAVVR